MASNIGNGPPDIRCIPENILVQIFQYLPVVDICRIRRVCRSWNRIAKDSSLWRHIDMTGSNLVITRVWKILRPNMAHIVSLKVGGPMELDRHSIRKNQFTTAMIKDLGKLCLRLQKLHIQDADLTKVLSSSLPPTLHSLHIIKCVVRAKWFAELLGTRPLPDLKQVSFSRSGRIADVDVEDLCELFPRLQSLDLSHCYRVSRGLEKVAESLSELEYLDISSRAIRGLSLDPFATGQASLIFNRILHKMLRNLKKLRVLRVSNERMQDTAIALIAGLKTLEELYIDNCTGQLSDSAFSNLSSAKTLRLLSMKNCGGVSEDAIRMFKENHPNCKVIH